MTKKKIIKDEGQVIEVEEERAPQIIEVSHTQAKKLVKKPMSDKQKENVNRLVEMNRQKWEAKKKEKEDKERQESESKVKVVVKPKRVYPSRKVVPKEDTETDDENYHSASDGNYQKKKYTKKYETETTEDEESTDIEPIKKPKVKRQSKAKKYDKMHDKLEQLEQRVKQNSFVSSRVFGLK
jgi:hypothetical protein